MNKVLCVILCICVVVALATCSMPQPGNDPTTAPSTAPGTPPTTAPTTSPVSTPTRNPVETDPVIYHLPMSAIVVTQQSEISQDHDFTYIYPNIRLHIPNDAVSETVTLDLLNRIDATRSNADMVRDDATLLSGLSCFYQVQYVPQRIDSALLSLSGTMTSFSGGAHPGTTCTGVTYDLLTGSVLTLDDILTDNCTADVICRLVVDALTALNDGGLLYSDFSVSVEDRFSGNYRADESWYLSQEGLCFTFEPYEVGPYSSGVVTAVIPYHALPGYLEDAWFPMERITAEGTVTTQPLTEGMLSEYGSITEVILDPDGDSIVITADNLVYDLTIRMGTQQEMILLAADQLTPGTAIVVRVSTSTRLTLEYHSNGETVTQPIRTS